MRSEGGFMFLIRETITRIDPRRFVARKNIPPVSATPLTVRKY
jgi:hypothetical protein